MIECSKADWKLFRERVPKWKENYMERLNQEYINLLQSEGNASDKFWELEERIKKDRKHPGVILEMRKSEMLYDILYLLRDGVIVIEDLEGFSEELKEQIAFMHGRQLI